MARSSAAPSRPVPTRTGLLSLGLPLLAGILLRLWLATRNCGLTMDSALYVRMAEDLLAGRRAPSPAHHGYPALIALASLVLPGRELPGRAVSMLASVALVAITWWVAKRRAGVALAWAPATLVALHPLLAVYGGAIMTESTFLGLACAGVALLEARRARAGGALLGAAWWVRPEAALLAPLAVALAPLRARERWLALALAACVALPYTIVLRIEQGHWSLTPKSVLVRAPFADARSAEWRLADSTAFADSTGLATRLARDGGAIARGYPSRLLAQSRGVLEAWSAPLLLLSLAGMPFAAGRGAGLAWLAFFALPLAYPLLSAPPDIRFAQLVVPALALAAGGALGATGRPPVGGLPAGVATRTWRLAAAAAALGGLALTWAGPAGRRALEFDDGPMTAMRGAGAWLAAHSDPDAVIMDRKSYVPFFAHRTHVQLPDESLDVVLRYAREMGATHIVVEEYVVGSLRPQLAPLLDGAWLAHESRVRMVFAARPAPGDGVAVLEVAR
jgi:hypothetical protein